MPGNRSPENGDSLTARYLYRANLAAADVDDPTDEDIPAINTRVTQPNYDTEDGVASIYGRNAQLDIAAFFRDGVKTATLKVYLLASIEYISSPPTDDVVVRWVLAASVPLTGSSLSVLKDLPPGQYKILVTALGAGAHLDLLTQYAA